MEKTLFELKKEMEEIQGQWNGKESGRAEERADKASTVIERLKEVEELLLEIDEF